MVLNNTLSSTPFGKSLEQPLRNARDPLIALREQAWQQLLQCDLPQKNTSPNVPLGRIYQQAFSYTPSSKHLSKEQVQAFFEKGCEESTLVFIDGHFQPELSAQGALEEIEVCDLQHAHPFQLFVETLLKKSLTTERSFFRLLALSAWQGGLFLYIPPELELKHPIAILNLITSRTPALVCPLLITSLAKRSVVSFKWRTIDLSDASCLFLPIFDIHLEEESRAECHWWHEHVDRLFSWEHICAQQKRNSSWKYVSLSTGSLLHRQEITSQLMQEGADTQLFGLARLKNKEQTHFSVKVDHLHPGCTSRQLFKCALYDTTRSSFSGKIFVDPIAQKTNAYQLNQNLLLSPYAIAYSQPELQIFADDVKASHGCTVGQLDEEQLFYLKSRGLSAETAAQLLADAFYQDILEQL